MNLTEALALVNEHTENVAWRTRIAEQYAGRSSSDFLAASRAAVSSQDALTDALTSPASFQVTLNVIPDDGPSYRHAMQIDVTGLTTDYNGDLTAYIQATGEVQHEWAFAPDTAQEA